MGEQEFVWASDAKQFCCVTNLKSGVATGHSIVGSKICSHITQDIKRFTLCRTQLTGRYEWYFQELSQKCCNVGADLQEAPRRPDWKSIHKPGAQGLLIFYELDSMINGCSFFWLVPEQKNI